MTTTPLIISKCKNCEKTAWPPQKHCSDCFGDTRLTPASKMGTIIEFSKKDDVYFCITQFDDIRLICTLKSVVTAPPTIGQKVEFLDHKRLGDKNIFEIVQC